MRRRRRSKLRKPLLLLGLTLTGFLIHYFWSGIPDVGHLHSQFPLVRYRGPEEPPAVKLQRKRPPNWVSLPQISRAAIGAVIVSEDWAFYQHKGFDSNQIKEAIKEDLEEGRFARGASTITQQVVRNVYLDRDKNLFRKVKELYLAISLERKTRKSRILEVYLNIAEWGTGLYGIGPAARHYFGKSPGELTAKEGAFLAMLLPSPRRYSQSFRARHLTDYARETIGSILDKMMQAGYLSEEERLIEGSRPLSFESPLSYDSDREHQ
ncbi:MAG TPA: biosynthetic peptidoglycan transglycosylase [Bdellovibrionota bacterium]|nr:biosynthetic peptidoglycan transglycosylase [Bdellovibrionota bacterium]